MPTPCLHYRHLVTRIDELSKKFVDDQAAAEAADPVGFTVDLDRLAAFRLLSHAELEYFLEAKAKENIDSIAANLGSNVTWMRNAPELLPLAITLGKPLPTTESLEATRFIHFVSELISAARTAIKDNKGVKERAFMTLSIFAGKTVDEIDSVLSLNLNSYGKDRGEVAHISVTHTRCIQAPSSELTSVRDLVRQLGVYFDVCP